MPLESDWLFGHNIHMKRTNLVLDEDLLKRATLVLGEKTYSGAVQKALQQAIHMALMRGMSDFVGSGIWNGDLAEMRQDTPPSRSKKKGK